MTGSGSSWAETDLADWARRILGWITALGVLGLAATGIWLSFFYQPTAALAWDDIDALTNQIAWGLRIRQFHGRLAIAVPVLAIAWLTLAIAARMQRRVLLLAGLLGAAVVGLVSGVVTPWRRVQLRSFTVGSNMTGFEPVDPDQDSNLVLLDGTQISATEIRGWVIVHLLAGLVALVLAGLALFSTRGVARGASRRTPVEAERPGPASPRA